MNYYEVCSHFDIRKRSRDQYGRETSQAICPIHKGGAERHPSLTITDAGNGRTLINCHVCGKHATSDILHAVGLRMSDIMPNQSKGKTVKEFAEYPGSDGTNNDAHFVESYDYFNEKGYCYTKCRIALPEGKSFKYCKTDQNGIVTDYGVKDRKNYAALYPFKSVQDAKDGDRNILIVEGEKDARNATADGLHAVTAGAAHDWTSAHAKHFDGLQVIVVPDNDAPGYKLAGEVVADLVKRNIPTKIIQWPDGFMDKGDYTDFTRSFNDQESGVVAFKGLMSSALTPEEFTGTLERSSGSSRFAQVESTTDQASESEVKAAAVKIQGIKGGKIFDPTDQECGDLIGQINDKSRYNVTAKQWYWYDGKRWALDAEGMHIEHCAAVFSKALIYYSMFFIKKDIPDNDVIAFRNACGSLSKRAKRVAAIQDARKVRHFSSEELDSDTTFLNCKNGVLNLNTFEFTPHDPALMLSKVAGCKYDPSADGNAWSQFLLQVMEGNEENVRFLQIIAGYMLTGEPVEDCFIILYGATTRNGKGTFCETLMRMFGDYGKSIRPESLAVKKYKDGSAASDDIARLAGVRFVNCSEPAKGMHLDEALVKSLTGGDTITARHLNERFFEFKTQFLIIMNVNYLPKVTDPTIFSSGRVIVVPFKRHFSEAEQDKRLKARLQRPENLSAVLNWAIEGLKIYRSEGLVIPASVKAATAEYADDSDKIKRFFADEMEEAAGVNSKVSEVYARFVQWCGASGMYVENKQSFMQMLRVRCLWMKTGTVNGVTAFNVIPGYRLTEFRNIVADLPEEW